MPSLCLFLQFSMCLLFAGYFSVGLPCFEATIGIDGFCQVPRPTAWIHRPGLSTGGEGYYYDILNIAIYIYIYINVSVPAFATGRTFVAHGPLGGGPWLLRVGPWPLRVDFWPQGGSLARGPLCLFNGQVAAAVYIYIYSYLCTVRAGVTIENCLPQQQI